MAIPILNEQAVFEKIEAQKNAFFSEYYAFYSSLFGGIIKNPRFMLLPIDDHMVHRGDGVFDAMKTINRSIYLLDAHLQRLFISAEKISLELPVTKEKIKEIILETLRAANHSDTSVRIFLSRGPGNFSVNPYESIQSQLYIVVSKLHPPSEEKYTQGIMIGKSHVPIKSSWLAQVKSCNYLPNVLMKKEAVDRGLDFVIAFDDQGNVTEGATENILLVDQAGTLVHPTFEYILKGTTMMRVCELAHEYNIPIEVRPISFNDVLSARELMITGTSLNVLPVVKFEDHIIGKGKPGSIAKKLNELMLEDIKSGVRGTNF